MFGVSHWLCACVHVCVCVCVYLCLCCVVALCTMHPSPRSASSGPVRTASQSQEPLRGRRMGGGDVSFGSMDQSEVEADVLDREGDDAEGHEVVRWGNFH